jgi:nucleoside-diphosphate-sugar epimerase
MRVLVTGAAGFLGAATVGAFSREGHTVHALVRSREQFAAIERRGGRPVLGDVLDGPSLEKAAARCDVAVHLAQPSDGTMEERRSVRVEGVRRLIRALRTAHVPRLVVGSGYWVYPDTPGDLTEESAIRPVSISQVNFETEEAARSAAREGGLDTIVVRPGMVYGAGSWFADIVSELRAGRYRYIGDGANHLSPVERDDTGAAFRLIAERAEAGSTYLVVDDRPVPTRTFAEFVATRLGVPAPGSMTLEEARREWGAELAELNRANRAASNAKLRTLGWVPRFPQYEAGVPGVLESMVPPT